MNELDFSPTRIRVVGFFSVIVYVLSLLDRYNKRIKIAKETKTHKVLYYSQLVVEIVLIGMGIALIYKPELWKDILDINVILILVDTALWLKYRREKN